MEPCFAKIKRLLLFPYCHGRGEMCREDERGGGKGGEGLSPHRQRGDQATQDQADLVMAAPIM